MCGFNGSLAVYLGGLFEGQGSGSGIDDFRLPRRVTLSTSYICDRFYQFGGVPGGYDELSIDQLPGKLMITKTAEKKAMTLIEVKGKGVVSQAVIQPKCKGKGDFSYVCERGFPRQ